MPEELKGSRSFASAFKARGISPKLLVKILERHGSELPPALIARHGLTHENTSVRVAALGALASFGPAAAEHAGAVVELGLTDDHPGVRLAAAEALGSFGPAAAEHTGAL